MFLSYTDVSFFLSLSAPPFLFLFFFLRFYLFIYLLEGKEKERKRNINVWLPFTCPQLGTWPATQACAPTGNRTGDLWSTGQCSIHWATHARAPFLFLYNQFSKIYEDGCSCVDFS